MSIDMMAGIYVGQTADRKWLESRTYLFCQIVQLLPTVVDELVDNDNLFSIDGRLLQLAHKCRNVPNLFVQRAHTAILRTHIAQSC
jgi:hypothetical protein